MSQLANVELSAAFLPCCSWTVVTSANLLEKIIYILEYLSLETSNLREPFIMAQIETQFELLYSYELGLVVVEECCC